MNVAFVFPGQGSQFAGMGEKLYAEFQTARDVFEEASDVLRFDMKELCFGSRTDQLIETAYTQPAVMTIGYALYRVWISETNVKPAMMTGHSLGEWTALVCGESLSFQEGLSVVRERGRLMAETLPGDYRMAAIMGMPVQQLEEDCQAITNEHGLVTISNYNSHQQTVVSGHASAVDRLVNQITKRNGKAVYLQVQSPFHSPLLTEAAKRFEEVLQSIHLKEPFVPVLSNVTGAPHTMEGMKKRLAKQIVRPVDWIACMEFLQEQRVEQVVEFGPGKSLRNVISYNLPRANILSIGALEDVEGIHQIPFTSDPQEESVPSSHRFIAKCLAIAVATENYAEAPADQWKDIEKAYEQIEHLLQSVEEENREATDDELRTVIRSLQLIFIGKQVPISERVLRSEELQQLPSIAPFLIQQVQILVTDDHPLTV